MRILLDLFWDVFVNLVKRLRIGAFGISVTSPAASASPSGVGPSRRVAFKIRWGKNALPKKVFEASLDLIDESPKNTSKVSASYGGAILRIRFRKVAWFSCKRGFVRFQQLALT